MQLRDYQKEAIDAFFEYFRRRRSGNPILQLPTGTGKSVIIAELLRLIHTAAPHHRTIVLTHVKELIAQNHAKLVGKDGQPGLWPSAPAGIYSAGLNRREYQFPITFAGVQSVHAIAAAFGRVDMVIIDEAHLVGDEDNARYIRFLSQLQNTNPYIRVCGLSATAYRQGMGPLTEGGIFTHVAYDLTTFEGFRRLLDAGHMAPLIVPKTQSIIDVSGVAISSNGEFNQAQLDAVTNDDALTRKCLIEAAHMGRDRNRWLVFTASIAHCERVSAILTEMGIDNAFVHSKMKGGRDEVLKAFADGELQVLVNKDMITTGHDYPELDFIVDMQGTRSTSKHVQKLGRATRPAPWAGKRNGLVADFARNCEELGPINDPVLPTPRRKRLLSKSAPIVRAPRVKWCPNPQCQCQAHVSATVCDVCGTEFPLVVKLAESVGTAEAMRLTPLPPQEQEYKPDIATIKVDAMTAKVHEQRKTGRQSVRIVYSCGLRMFPEYLCCGEGYEGPPRRRAEEWWRARMPGTKLPTVASEALAIIESPSFPQPKFIRVWANTKQPTVVDHVY